MGTWLLHWLGLDDPSGRIYLAWSGPGSDLSELTLIAIPIAYVRHHTCHEPRCWRLGHPDLTGAVRCRRHIRRRT